MAKKFVANMTLIFTFIITLNIFAQHVEWSKDAVIYEVNIRQYTKEGTLNAFSEHLPRLKKLGVKILWIMPIHPVGEENRKGSLGSYYAVKDYEEVNPEFGTIEDLKDLVEKAHKMGMYVILDWVANHTAWDHNWTKTHPDFYTKNSTGNFIPPVEDWSDVIDLNYDNKELRSEMLSALKFWINETDIDGYRCDVAEMVPGYFWHSAISELRKIKPIFMLAEGEKPELHLNGFDMTYSWQFFNVMNDIGKGEKKASEVIKYFAKENSLFEPDDYRMLFVTNHDENSWNKPVEDRLGDGEQTFLALIYTLKGMPLIYSGQEAGFDKPLEFFEKDQINWQDDENGELFEELGQLKINHQALWNGSYGSDMKFINTENENVILFLREKNDDTVIGIFNLSPKKEEIEIKNASQIIGGYKDYMKNKDFTIEKVNKIILKPWEYKILVR